MSDQHFEQSIAAWLDGRISEADSEILQQRLRKSVGARAAFREYVHLDVMLRELAGGDGNSTESVDQSSGQPVRSAGPWWPDRWNGGPEMWTQLAVAAAILLIVGGVAYRFGKRDVSQPSVQIANAKLHPVAETERTIAGYATLRRGADIQWPPGAESYREGDVLPAGVLEFDGGVAEIDFFCGATLVVEGPAKMNLESDWTVRLLAGRLRASVPPAARGFVVKAADSEIIDLGTEFALEVGPENVRVEVIDGEVKLRGGEFDGDHLVTGEGQSLIGIDAGDNSLKGLSTISDVGRRHEAAQQQRLAQWKTHSQQLRADGRLIAYYPIAESTAERSVPNMADTGHDLDGHLVGLVDRTMGRLGSGSTGLHFDRPGARVRTRIDGEFQAFTFACWARIDELGQKYSALFMGDGYENGEPHWQIRDDGRLMFSVMVDDTQEVRVPNAFDQQIVKDAGVHRIYFTEPFWDISKSGQWFHLAAVYDPIGRRVSQYVNGQQLSSEEILDRFHITKLRIGPAEIGNWGQPFRKTPWFAVRNLNGAIDELAIYNAALNADEIETLYENGKPFGY